MKIKKDNNTYRENEGMDPDWLKDNENEPLYSLPDDGDETDSEVDDYLYDLEEEPDDEVDENDERFEKKPSPLGVLIKTLLTPVEGWKALKRAKFSTELFANRCFIPSVCFVALSEVVKVFYEANLTIGDILTDALCSFLIFFFGYFTIIFCGSLILPRKSRVLMKKDIGKQFVMLNLASLALFMSSLNIVPMLDPVLVFLPIWTIYLIYKGIRVIRVPADVENSSTTIMVILIVGIPVLWNWILKEILFPFAG